MNHSLYELRELYAGRSKPIYSGGPMHPNMIADVILFHRVFGHPVLDKPGIPAPERQSLRNKLIKDEYEGELVPAFSKCQALRRFQAESHPDEVAVSEKEMCEALVEFGDAIVDVIYFLIGAAAEYGIPLAAMWEVVQEANMSKLWTKLEVDKSENVIEGNWHPRRVACDTDSNGRCFVVYDDTGKVKKPPSWQDPAPKLLAIIQKARNGGNGARTDTTAG